MLELEEEKIKNRLSNLIDLRLDGSIDKDVFIIKENELKTKKDNLKKQKEEFIALSKENDNMFEKIKEIEKIVLAPKVLNGFDREVFDNIIDKIIVGRIKENGEKEPNFIRFILKTGEEYDKLYHYNREKLSRQKPTKKMELNGSDNVV